MMLKLDSNEGPAPSAALLASLASLDPELLRRYPDIGGLEAALAERLGVTPERVIVTAGADEAIDRAFRAFLTPGRSLTLPDPSFEMFYRFAALVGAQAERIVRVPWGRGPFPTAAFVSALHARTGVAVVVSPNNPTGAVASADDVRRISAARPDAIVLLDHAYVEYADDDLTEAALALPNVLVLRTLSKAWGLAGCRVGYAVGSRGTIAAMRAAGGPYTVAGPSVALALARLAGPAAELRDHVARIREERAALIERLTALGLDPAPSQTNFVFVECGARASFIAAALDALGVVVRAFPDRPALTTALRITLPGDTADFARLVTSLETVLAPEALLFDLDGVLADVRDSQRAAIAATAQAFGVGVTPADIAAEIRAGDANNDWVVTHRLIARRDAGVSLADVTARYQPIYLGLRDQERLIPARALLETLAARLPLAIVTGRPRDEARWFLERAGIAELFAAVVAMEDAPVKPSPAPLRLALERLGVRRAWMVGDTPDDVTAAAGADVVPLGVIAPGDDALRTSAALQSSGAACVLNDVADLAELLR
ncbi:MAG: aminotransferase class I/II-fold pyridoxal phosphate-dependent enzyme [Gemmatimonadales bacterium]|nr:aminotransferase class I/II-fold pyridoxal phosphate-dependent enzyme [Gemmatimonadales bacterium]